MDDFIEYKNLIRKNLSNQKYWDILDFLKEIKIENLDEELKKEWIEIYPLLHRFDDINNIEKFLKNLKIWREWETNHKENKIVDKLKDYKRFDHFLSEIIVWWYLFEKFWIEKVFCEVKSNWKRNVDFLVKYNWEDYYIEVKTIDESDEEKANTNDIHEVDPDNKIEYQEIIDEVKKMKVTHKEIRFTFSYYDLVFSLDKKGNRNVKKDVILKKELIEKLTKDFILFIKNIISEWKTGSFNFFENSTSKIIIKDTINEELVIIPEKLDRLEEKIKTYILQFPEKSYNILFINVRNGLNIDEYDIEDLFWKIHFFQDGRWNYNMQKFVSNWFLTKNEWKKIGMIIYMKEYKTNNLKFFPNDYASTVISEEYINKIK